MARAKGEQIEFDGMPPADKPTRTKREDKPITTAQRLGSLVKSARDVMRKDKGLSGDADRLPQLTWLMFLKFLDDLEHSREEEALLAD
jgi:type I restriction enzyme M protein